MVANTTLTMDVAVTAEERADRWAFYVHEFGFTVYAKTREEGSEVVREAIAALLNSFDDDNEKLRGFLNSHRVKHHFGVAGGAVPRSREIGTALAAPERREIEVALAAAG